MDTEHLGISSALLCLPEAAWMRPCSAPLGGSVPLQHWGSLQISSAPADIGLPRQAWEGSPKPMSCPRSLQTGNEQHPTPARSAGWWEAELAPQLAGAGKGTASPCLPALLWQAGPAGAVEGGRQLPRFGQRRRQQASLTNWSRKRPPAWDSSACLSETGWLFPAPPMPLLHQQS